MPGFNIQTTNKRAINNKAEFRRKHRWRVTVGGPLNSASWLYLQKAQRPSFKYNEAVVHHDQEQAYFAGKQEWETITLTFYDVENAGGGTGDLSKKIYEWIAAGGSKDVGSHNDATVKLPNQYKLDVTLQMTDAAGDASETWTLFGAWPLSVNWQDLDYTNTEIQVIEVVIRYDRATRT